MARALLTDRPILVLDEPAAHLDPAGATELRRRDLTASADKTVLWITHRQADLEAFDQVVVIDHGGCQQPARSHQLPSQPELSEPAHAGSCR